MVGQSSDGEILRWVNEKGGPNTNCYETSRQRWSLGAPAIQPTPHNIPHLHLCRVCDYFDSSIEKPVGEGARKKRRRRKGFFIPKGYTYVFWLGSLQNYKIVGKYYKAHNTSVPLIHPTYILDLL